MWGGPESPHKKYNLDAQQLISSDREAWRRRSLVWRWESQGDRSFAQIKLK
ncbi:hypothetical protein [Microcoleus sp. LEGE 07076]|uniref:hypothetical protein n=1 Tax=Microcoleus sp. LEGE 07076 TaxID=915322 RepID=UPI00187E6A5D|nr:hypothetical protein [Microcoleus sp. LEGE 07076]